MPAPSQEPQRGKQPGRLPPEQQEQKKASQRGDHERQWDHRNRPPARQNRSAAPGTIAALTVPHIMADSALHRSVVPAAQVSQAEAAAPAGIRLARSLAIDCPQYTKHARAKKQPDRQCESDPAHLAPPYVPWRVREKQFADEPGHAENVSSNRLPKTRQFNKQFKRWNSRTSPVYAPRSIDKARRRHFPLATSRKETKVWKTGTTISGRSE